eukprot:6095725-Pyramimonas_sp.AAC.1
MPVGTRANPQTEAPAAMANPPQPQPDPLLNMAIQKANDRMIDAPTVCADSNAVTIAAINLININTIDVCSSWIKLYYYGQFKGDGTGMSNSKFICKFTDLISDLQGAQQVSDYFSHHRRSCQSANLRDPVHHLRGHCVQSLISPYSKKADDEDANERDGRRAFFFALLLREFFPRTTNSAGDAEKKLRSFKFTTDKTKNVAQRAG